MPDHGEGEYAPVLLRLRRSLVVDLGVADGCREGGQHVAVKVGTGQHFLLSCPVQLGQGENHFGHEPRGDLENTKENRFFSAKLFLRNYSPPYEGKMPPGDKALRQSPLPLGHPHAEAKNTNRSAHASFKMCLPRTKVFLRHSWKA